MNTALNLCLERMVMLWKLKSGSKKNRVAAIEMATELVARGAVFNKKHLSAVVKRTVTIGESEMLDLMLKSGLKVDRYRDISDIIRTWKNTDGYKQIFERLLATIDPKHSNSVMREMLINICGTPLRRSRYSTGSMLPRDSTKYFFEKMDVAANPDGTVSSKTPLMVAAGFKNAVAVKILLELGADHSKSGGVYNNTNTLEGTPLLIAIQSCMPRNCHSVKTISKKSISSTVLAIVKMLVEAGADVNATYKGQNAYQLACKIWGPRPEIKFLSKEKVKSVVMTTFQDGSSVRITIENEYKKLCSVQTLSATSEEVFTDVPYFLTDKKDLVLHYKDRPALVIPMQGKSI